MLTRDTAGLKLRQLTALEGEFIKSVDDNHHTLLYKQFSHFRHDLMNCSSPLPKIAAIALNADVYENATHFVQRYGAVCLYRHRSITYSRHF